MTNKIATSKAVTAVLIGLLSTAIPLLAQNPVISAITNSASYLGCGGVIGTTQTIDGDIPQYSCSIAPGELVSIFGRWLAPSKSSALSIDPTTGLVYLLPVEDNSNVLVTFTDFDGKQWGAPLLYVSDTQVNCIVPFEVILSFNSPGLQYGGTRDVRVVNTISAGASNVLTVSVKDTQPGIFTNDASGSGQGAILNQNGSVNSANNPEVPGNIVSVFMTGAGAMMMPTTESIGWGFAEAKDSKVSMIDGGITCFFGCSNVSDIPVPTTYPFYALVNGGASNAGSAPDIWAGSAPNLVEGVVQVNFQIPLDTHSGTNTLNILAGTFSNQWVQFAAR